MLMQKRRSKAWTVKRLRTLLKNQSIRQECIVTDCLASYDATPED